MSVRDHFRKVQKKLLGGFLFFTGPAEFSLPLLLSQGLQNGPKHGPVGEPRWDCGPNRRAPRSGKLRLCKFAGSR
jgi:hypothetical protein